MRPWRTGIQVEYTDSDRAREQAQARQADPKYYQHVQGIEARPASPRVQDPQSRGKQASELAGLHSGAEARLQHTGASPELMKWHRAKRERAQFVARRATDTARVQASFKRRGRGR